MPMLALALVTGTGAFVYVTWTSWAGGYPPELALVRGVGGFMAMSLLGFIAELAIATSPGGEERRETPPPPPCPAEEVAIEDETQSAA
ncbi:MAG: hypothetical protein EXR66_00515 [Dehalococcoidia bacterium]|nr:hypothetical protein [Dehalococcoidia bacterium]